MSEGGGVMSGLGPYVVQDSGWDHDGLMGLVEQGCAAHVAVAGRASGVGLFGRMLDDVLSMGGRRVGTIEQVQRGEANLCVRVDVDMDVVTAVEMAAVANSSRVPVTFFVLHTASYYGVVIDGVFHRHESMGELYRRLQGPMTAVGLHTDGLHLGLNEGVDGAAGVVAELGWLRSLGLEIRGTAAHNYARMYGAENFELFRGRVIRPEGVVSSGDRVVELGVLDEVELGLTFEAGDPRPSNNYDFEAYMAAGPSVPGSSELYVRWGYDYQAWIIGDDTWGSWGWDADDDPWYEGPESWADVRRRIDSATADTRVCLTLHPIYFGARAQSV